MKPGDQIERMTYSTAEAAQAMGVAERYVQTLIARGELPSFKAGRKRLILRTDVADYLQALRDEQMGLITRLRSVA